jgi:hypothetical protein
MPLAITRPTWQVIEDLIRGSRSRLIICSPWISVEGVRKLSEYLTPDPPLPALEIWTRLADVLTHSRGIEGLARTLRDRGTTVVIRDSGDLHAKIYYADDNAAVFGSANLGAKGMDGGLEIVASTTDAAEVSQIKAVLKSIEPETQVVSLEALDYFNTNQRPELEEAERDIERPNIVPVWRRDRPIPEAAKSEGRRAFLVGEGPRSESVHLIVKMALWGKRSINVYDMLANTRVKRYPASDEAIEGYRARGYEIEEPYLAEGEKDLWIRYGIETAGRLGLRVEKRTTEIG